MHIPFHSQRTKVLNRTNNITNNSIKILKEPTCKEMSPGFPRRMRISCKDHSVE